MPLPSWPSPSPHARTSAFTPKSPNSNLETRSFSSSFESTVAFLRGPFFLNLSLFLLSDLQSSRRSVTVLLVVFSLTLPGRCRLSFPHGYLAARGRRRPLRLVRGLREEGAERRGDARHLLLGRPQGVRRRERHVPVLPGQKGRPGSEHCGLLLPGSSLILKPYPHSSPSPFLPLSLSLSLPLSSDFLLQYLLQPRIAAKVSKTWGTESVVVFDEAHNIDDVCIEAFRSSSSVLIQSVCRLSPSPDPLLVLKSTSGCPRPPPVTSSSSRPP